MMSKYLLLILGFIINASCQRQSQSFQSFIKLAVYGTAFQPHHPIELLSNLSNIQSIFKCAMHCNRNRQCRTFDYDRSSLVCRLFEGEITTGLVLNVSIPFSSRVGSIQSDTILAVAQYAPFNQPCNQCSIGVNRYLECKDNTCQCPQNTYWNGQLCLNQLYNGSQCNTTVACRSDLNFTCWIQTRTCMIQKRGGKVSFMETEESNRSTRRRMINRSDLRVDKKGNMIS